MDIFEAESGAVTIIQVSGRVNSTNATVLGTRLDGIIAAGDRAIVIDLGRLDHITSAGFRVLLLADQAAARRPTPLVLCGMSGLTLELFEIGGFLDMFDVVETRAEAVDRAGQERG